MWVLKKGLDLKTLKSAAVWGKVLTQNSMPIALLILISKQLKMVLSSVQLISLKKQVD
uniref:Uncharacterized protein n=1 Tax=Moniliophthora roreri TaxID=221103 RepID=A0A0W0F7K1_MONRR